MRANEQLIKQGSGFGASIIDALSQLGAMGVILLAATTGTTGIGIGYVAAKATAHGNQDIETSKKEYENERLKADLGYLSTKTMSEYDEFKKRQAPKPARVII